LSEEEPHREVDVLSEAFFRDRNVAENAAAAHQKAGAPWRRMLPRVAIVLAALALIDVAVRCLVPPEALLDFTHHEEAVYGVKLAQFKSAPTPDVVFLGSSRVRDGMVPEVFSGFLSKEWKRPARVYNLGLINAKAEEYLTIVRSHLPDPGPRLVVLGITGSEVVNVHDFQYASRFLWTLPDALDWLRRVPAAHFDVAHVEHFLENELCRGWYVFGHRDALREMLLDTLVSRFGVPLPVAAGGTDNMGQNKKLRDYVLAADGYQAPPLTPQGSLARRIVEAPQLLKIPERELEASPEMLEGARFTELREIAALLDARGSRLALVEMPVSPYLQERNPVLHGQVFRDRMEQLAQELGCVWVPMPPEETQLSNRTYGDVNHLTEVGAKRYTRLLFERLSERGFFKEPQP